MSPTGRGRGSRVRRQRAINCVGGPVLLEQGKKSYLRQGPALDVLTRAVVRRICLN